MVSVVARKVLSILAKMALMTSDIIKVGLSSRYCDVKNGHKSPWKAVPKMEVTYICYRVFNWNTGGPWLAQISLAQNFKNSPFLGEYALDFSLC